MPQGKDVTVRLQALGGVWETCGADRERGVWPENVTVAADRWGSSSASFDLKRDPRVNWPDITAYTPVEIEIGGSIRWSGRVKETPARDGGERTMNVQCEGWQYHLDDDSFTPFYAHARLADYRDARSFATANLTICRQSGQVTSGDGGITLGWPGTETLNHNDMVGVVLDLGPNSNGWQRIVVDWESSNNISAAMQFIARGMDNEFAQSGAASNDAFVLGGLSGASGTSSGTIATRRRYVHLYMYWSGAGTVSLVQDAWTKIKRVLVVNSTDYESGNQSILKASHIIPDALIRGTSLLSADRTQIQTTSFNIPEFQSRDYRTPREVWSAANAYHNYYSKIDEYNRAVFKPLPSAPLVEVGEWSQMDFQDASSNSGEEIYNRVVVQWTGPTGTANVASRTQTSVATLPDRRGFTKTAILPVQAALDDGGTAANQIGDTWLNAHVSTPFKGTLTVTGQDSVRDVISGNPVAPDRLLTLTGELLRFTDRPDPDTSAWGRDGRIAAVSYVPATDTATVTIDSSRADFEALLARLAVVSGNG